jgi:hypothetical protein
LGCNLFFSPQLTHHVTAVTTHQYSSSLGLGRNTFCFMTWHSSCYSSNCFPLPAPRLPPLPSPESNFTQHVTSHIPFPTSLPQFSLLTLRLPTYNLVLSSAMTSPPQSHHLVLSPAMTSPPKSHITWYCRLLWRHILTHGYNADTAILDPDSALARSRSCLIIMYGHILF